MKLLVTGGCGFIGSNLIHHLLAERPTVEIVNLDLLTYAGNPDNLADVAGSSERYRFIHGDICDPVAVASAMEAVDAVLNVAAESHVDRSIASGAPFVRTNVLGTHVLLSAALDAGVRRFIQVSTDEVYGELPAAPVLFTETSPLNPRSPYSATKAAADHLALAFHHTHGLDVVIARSSNNYGPFQFPEKLIPLTITRALEGEELPLYGDGLHIRDWLHVRDHCRALLAALEKASPGRVYNFGGCSERKNIDVVRAIISLLDADPSLLTFVPDRPGHDRRYGSDISRARHELDWEPRTSFETGLAETVRWYRDHEEWWRRVESWAYRTGGEMPSAHGKDGDEGLS